jgi:glutathione S-transferase
MALMRGIDHMDLVVRSLDRSLPWYRELLEPLGYTRTSEIEGERGERVVYLSIPGGHHMGSISLREATDAADVDRYRLGAVHHIAFAAATRDRVDARAGWLREQGAEIESGPEQHDEYTPGYYAVFFRDPDGVKLEILHRPRVFHEKLVLYDQPASSNCMKVRIAARQVGADYERVEVDIFRGDARAEEARGRNESGRTPVLEIDGRPLAESGAILSWLTERTPLLPDDRFERAQVQRWLFFEQNQIEPWIAVPRYLRLTNRDRGQVDAMTPRGREGLEILERALSDGREFLANGTYSIADIANYAYVHVAPDAGLSLEPYEAVREWLARVEATPGFVNDLTPMPPHAVKQG